MGELFDSFDVEAIRGENITIGKYFPEVFVSETDEVFCYCGICLSNDNSYLRSVFMHPYYMHEKHSNDKSIKDKIINFYRVVDGCIVLDDYVDGEYNKTKIFKRIPAGVRFSGADCYYSVLIDGQENKELTRKIFGLTYNDSEAITSAYSKVMGIYNAYMTYPRLTRSMKNQNYCDLSSVLIPEQFPYIAFSESGYSFSHVSIWGFCRHLQVLTGQSLRTPFSQALIENEVDEDALKALFSVGRQSYSKTKVTLSELKHIFKE